MDDDDNDSDGDVHVICNGSNDDDMIRISRRVKIDEESNACIAKWIRMALLGDGT